MELNDLGQDDIFDVESISHSSCKRNRALNLSDRSQILKKKSKTTVYFNISFPIH